MPTGSEGLPSSLLQLSYERAAHPDQGLSKQLGLIWEAPKHRSAKILVELQALRGVYRTIFCCSTSVQMLSAATPFRSSQAKPCRTGPRSATSTGTASSQESHAELLHRERKRQALRRVPEPKLLEGPGSSAQRNQRIPTRRKRGTAPFSAVLSASDGVRTEAANRRKFRRECQAESFRWHGSAWTL